MYGSCWKILKNDARSEGGRGAPDHFYESAPYCVFFLLLTVSSLNSSTADITSYVRAHKSLLVDQGRWQPRLRMFACYSNPFHCVWRAPGPLSAGGYFWASGGWWWGGMGTQGGKLPLESLARACTTYMGICVCVWDLHCVFLWESIPVSGALITWGEGGGVSQRASSVVASQPGELSSTRRANAEFFFLVSEWSGTCGD